MGRLEVGEDDQEGEPLLLGHMKDKSDWSLPSPTRSDRKMMGKRKRGFLNKHYYRLLKRVLKVRERERENNMDDQTANLSICHPFFVCTPSTICTMPYYPLNEPPVINPYNNYLVVVSELDDPHKILTQRSHCDT